MKTAAFVALLSLGMASAAAAQTARPTTLTLVPGVVTLENVQYAAGTPTDLTQPATGSGRMVVTYGGFTVGKDGVTFTHLIFDAQGQLQGVVLTLDSKVTTQPIAGCVFEMPSGDITWRSPDALSFTAPMSVRFPFRNPDGSFVTASTRSLRAQKTTAKTDVTLDSLVLQGPAGANGFALTGVVQIAAAPWKLHLAWSDPSQVTWEATIPSARVGVAVPGLVSAGDFPIKGNGTGIQINQKGEVDIQSATIVNDGALQPIQVQGFELKIKSGSFGMQKSVPSFQSIVADLTFPALIQNAAGNGPAIVHDVGLNLSDLTRGLVLDIGNATSSQLALDGLVLGKIRLLAKSMVLDLSSFAGPVGSTAPPRTTDPAWTGVWFKTGELRFPLDGDTLTIGLEKFFVDLNGISGLSELRGSQIPASFRTLDLKGFKVNLSRLKLEFLRNQIVSGGIGGGIDIPNLGDLDAKIEFSLRGLEAIALSSKSGLSLSHELGFSLRDIKGSLALDVTPPMLVLSGVLNLDNPSLNTKVTNFRIDGSGKFYFPEEGVLTLTEPAVVSVFDALEVEVRRIGFTCPDGIHLQSISFTGACRFKNPVEGMELGGEIDLEHFTVGLPIDPQTGPKIEIGGLGLGVTIPELGTIGASLKMRDDLPGFVGSNVLYGDAQLALQPLNGVGLDVTFLMTLDPNKPAWFVGGDAALPTPIQVQIPPAPPVPMIPLFQVCGFLGGFGMNVVPISTDGGVGPIKDPETELKYSSGAFIGQAGVMLAEYAVGAHLWWADATLTATFNPTMFDLTGRMSLLDLDDVSPFPSKAEWKKRDRIASVFVNLDLDAHPSLSLGGDLDMNFPTRDFALVDASGEALMRFSENEKFLRVGCWWCDKKQKPMRIQVAQALDDYMEMKGDAGMNVDFEEGTAEMRLDAKVEFKPVKMKGTLDGDLAVTNIGKPSMKAEGDLDVKGVADFDVVECTVRGKVHATCTANDFDLTGTLHGKVGCFEGDVSMADVLP